MFWSNFNINAFVKKEISKNLPSALGITVICLCFKFRLKILGNTGPVGFQTHAM